jgi:predicted ester cyclase
MDERNDSAVSELLAPGFKAVLEVSPPMTAGEWAGTVEMMYGPFPDGEDAIDEPLEIGDRVVLRGRISGTHTGAVTGLPPTGRKITVTFLTLDRLAGDRLGEHPR